MEKTISLERIFFIKHIIINGLFLFNPKRQCHLSGKSMREKGDTSHRNVTPTNIAKGPLLGRKEQTYSQIQHRSGTRNAPALSQKIYPKGGAAPALVKFLKK
ncbi:MAG: hypothetical protein ABF443_07490 [Acetobacter malorum]|uniref:hypothetical protein n=1 Tax=Acetobacter malorum TaxID=178901 RepID=UPI0039E7E5F2